MNNMKALQYTYMEAKRRVRKLKAFYFHLVIFLLGNLVLMVNSTLINQGEYYDFWIGLILGTLVLWSTAILVHAMMVFGNGALLNKKREVNQIKNR